jgi:hypothetical protein
MTSIGELKTEVFSIALPAQETCLFLYSPNISLKTPFETNFPPFVRATVYDFEFAADYRVGFSNSQMAQRLLYVNYNCSSWSVSR